MIEERKGTMVWISFGQKREERSRCQEVVREFDHRQIQLRLCKKDEKTSCHREWWEERNGPTSSQSFKSKLILQLQS